MESFVKEIILEHLMLHVFFEFQKNCLLLQVRMLISLCQSTHLRAAEPSGEHSALHT